MHIIVMLSENLYLTMVESGSSILYLNRKEVIQMNLYVVEEGGLFLN